MTAAPVVTVLPSDLLLDVLGYTAGIRKLHQAADRGVPLVPGAVDRECQRIERCVAHVLNAIVGPP